MRLCPETARGVRSAGVADTVETSWWAGRLGELRGRRPGSVTGLARARGGRGLILLRLFFLSGHLEGRLGLLHRSKRSVPPVTVAQAICTCFLPFLF